MQYFLLGDGKKRKDAQPQLWGGERGREESGERGGYSIVER